MLDRTAIVRVIDAWESDHEQLLSTSAVLDLADRLLTAMRAQLEEQHTDWWAAVRGKSTDERLDAVRNIAQRSFQRGRDAVHAELGEMTGQLEAVVTSDRFKAVMVESHERIRAALAKRRRTDGSGRNLDQILADYFDGPGGEPNIADAHDYLMAIADIMRSSEP